MHNRHRLVVRIVSMISKAWLLKGTLMTVYDFTRTAQCGQGEVSPHSITWDPIHRNLKDVLHTIIGLTLLLYPVTPRRQLLCSRITFPIKCLSRILTKSYYCCCTVDWIKQKRGNRSDISLLILACKHGGGCYHIISEYGPHSTNV